MPVRYAEHRRAFLDRLRERRAAAVVFTATPRLRNGDSEYRFRPDSDFWYLTGFREPEAALVLLPDLAADAAPSKSRSVLFLRERDREKETWSGRRLGVESAPERLGVDEAHPIEEIWKLLPGLLRGYERIVYRAGAEEERDREMLRLLERLRRGARGGILPPVEILDPTSTLHEQRLIKTQDEIAAMRRAAAISAEAHQLAMRTARPGLFEHELEAVVESTFRRLGSTGPAYTSIVAGGPNATILHYVENSERLREGDLVLIDAGAEWDYYASDVTRTFPADGRFRAEQRALYEVVLAAQQRAIAAVGPGATVRSIHEIAVRGLCEGLARLGLVEGGAAQAFDSGAYQRFYMHRTSHWLGLDVHDCGAYSQGGGPRPLEPGMVLTVEPGLYVAEDADVDPRWRGIGVRIEDDVLVTAGGHEVLTAAIPKEVGAIEEACRAAVPVA